MAKARRSDIVVIGLYVACLAGCQSRQAVEILDCEGSAESDIITGETPGCHCWLVQQCR
jgi:hypothetical protein